MKKLLGALVSPAFLTLLGLAAWIALVWWGGPMLGFGRWHPLESYVARWALIGMVVALVLGRALWKAWQARRRDAALTQGLVAQAAPSAGEEEVKALSQNFEHALALLKKVRFAGGAKRPGDWLALANRQYLDQWPWYLLIGAPGSGKTQALVHSGLNFPLAEAFGTQKIQGIGGTRNCDWWFTDEAVLIDTAGRYTTQESDASADAIAWKGFLDLLKQARPRRPIDGVLLTLNAVDLLQQTPAERTLHDAALRARLQELHQTLGTRFPIYLLVTKLDLLAGFDAFFGALTKEERAQVWGMTFAAPPGAAEGKAIGAASTPALAWAGFAGEFDALQQRLVDRVLDRMQALRDPAQRAAVHAFPQQFGQLQPLLAETLARVFEPSRFEPAPMLRGVYFTSGTQEGHPIDRLMGQLARSLRLQRHVAAPPLAAGRSFFITDLLRRVVFAERGLAGTDRRWQRRRARLQAGGAVLAVGVVGLAAALWGHAAWQQRQAVGAIAARLPALDQQLANLPASGDGSDLAALMPLLGQVRDLAQAAPGDGDAGGFGGFGLSQRAKLQAAAELRYRRLLQDALLPRIKQRLAHQLKQAGADNLEVAYESLKAYRMLHDRDHFDGDALRGWIGADLERALPGEPGAPLRSQLDRHLAVLFERGVAQSSLREDEALVTQARQMLASYPFAQRVYSRLRREGVGSDVAEFNAVKAAGPGVTLAFTRASGAPLTRGVPGLYTYDGYHKAFVSAAERKTTQLAGEEPWVLGSAGGDASATPAQRLETVRRLYLTDYAKVWEDYLADFKLIRAGSLQQSLAQAQLLAAPDSPLPPLLRAASHETTLGRKPGAEATMVDKASEKIKSTQAEIGKLFGTGSAATAPLTPAGRPEAIVDDRFDALRRLVTPAAPGQPAPLDATLAAVGEMANTMAAADLALKSKAPLPPLEPLNRAKAMNRLPEPLQSAVQSLATVATAILLGQSRTQLAASVSSEVGDFCQKALAGRYPFTRGVDRDVLPDDFAKLFAPGGSIEAFFQKNLADKVDRAARPWQFKAQHGASFGGPGTLAQFQRAEAIRDVFFRGGGAQPSFRLAFRPASMDAAVTQFSLNVDGQLVTYSHGPQVEHTVQWPGPGGARLVRVEMQPPGPAGVSAVKQEGPWALFRLFDTMTIVPGASPERFRVVFNVDGRKAEFDVVASSVQNPFKLRELEQFQCPQGL